MSSHVVKVLCSCLGEWTVVALRELLPKLSLVGDGDLD